MTSEPKNVAHRYYSQRTGSNPNSLGLPLNDIVGIFEELYSEMENDGYFAEDFGQWCPDNQYQVRVGAIRDVARQILFDIKKRELWPIHQKCSGYSEADFLDVVEFLYQHVSKPVDGTPHGWNGCEAHWETFNRADGQARYRERINDLLSHYERPFELTASGEVLSKPEAGFEQIFEADIPSKDVNVVDRVNAATLRYRRHGSSVDDRRQAVNDLAGVLEYLRPKVKEVLTSADESDLFNLANNFGIRHHNDRQKTAYDASLWLSWMFYFYLATIHVSLRKIQQVAS